MDPLVRLFFLAALIALAGCTIGVSERGGGGAVTATPTGTVGDTDETQTGALSPGFEPADRIEVRVLDVVDGDTVDVRLPDGSEDTVRLVGIDTPEVHAETAPLEYEGVPGTSAGRACLRSAGEDASAFLDSRIDGEQVTLVVDPNADRRGGYGRLLAYVSHDGQNLNWALVAAGHARVYDTDFALRDAFDSAEVAARGAGRGLWRCRNPD
jgi:micrococcal nuclease